MSHQDAVGEAITSLVHATSLNTENEIDLNRTALRHDALIKDLQNRLVGLYLGLTVLTLFFLFVFLSMQ